jgi:hypothetical protein
MSYTTVGFVNSPEPFIEYLLCYFFTRAIPQVLGKLNPSTVSLAFPISDLEDYSVFYFYFSYTASLIRPLGFKPFLEFW